MLIARLTVRGFLSDRRGTSLVTYTLVLPVLLLLVFGAATVWRVISIRHSVDLAAFEAVRFLSREGRALVQPYDAETWRTRALQAVSPFIEAQIRRNPFVADEDPILVEIIPPVDVDCPGPEFGAMQPNYLRPPDKIRFTLVTTVVVQTPFEIPFLSDVQLTLRQAYDDVVECPRAFRTEPPEEGDIY